MSDGDTQDVAHSVGGGPAETVLIERTAKRFKALKVGGACLSCLGLVLIVSLGAALESYASIAAGAAVFIAGMVMFVAARIGAWWYHG